MAVASDASSVNMIRVSRVVAVGPEVVPDRSWMIIGEIRVGMFHHPFREGDPHAGTGDPASSHPFELDRHAVESQSSRKASHPGFRGSGVDQGREKHVSRNACGRIDDGEPLIAHGGVISSPTGDAANCPGSL